MKPSIVWPERGGGFLSVIVAPKHGVLFMKVVARAR